MRACRYTLLLLVVGVTLCLLYSIAQLRPDILMDSMHFLNYWNYNNDNDNDNNINNDDGALLIPDKIADAYAAAAVRVAVASPSQYSTSTSRHSHSNRMTIHSLFSYLANTTICQLLSDADVPAMVKVVAGGGVAAMVIEESYSPMDSVTGSRSRSSSTNFSTRSSSSRNDGNNNTNHSLFRSSSSSSTVPLGTGNNNSNNNNNNNNNKPSTTTTSTTILDDAAADQYAWELLHWADVRRRQRRLEERTTLFMNPNNSNKIPKKKSIFDYLRNSDDNSNNNDDDDNNNNVTVRNPRTNITHDPLLRILLVGDSHSRYDYVFLIKKFCGVDLVIHHPLMLHHMRCPLLPQFLSTNNNNTNQNTNNNSNNDTNTVNNTHTTTSPTPTRWQHSFTGVDVLSFTDAHFPEESSNERRPWPPWLSDTLIDPYRRPAEVTALHAAMGNSTGLPDVVLVCRWTWDMLRLSSMGPVPVEEDISEGLVALRRLYPHTPILFHGGHRVREPTAAENDPHGHRSRKFYLFRIWPYWRRRAYAAVRLANTKLMALPVGLVHGGGGSDTGDGAGESNDNNNNHDVNMKRRQRWLPECPLPFHYYDNNEVGLRIGRESTTNHDGMHLTHSSLTPLLLRFLSGAIAATVHSSSSSRSRNKGTCWGRSDSSSGSSSSDARGTTTSDTRIHSTPSGLPLPPPPLLTRTIVPPSFPLPCLALTERARRRAPAIMDPLPLAQWLLNASSSKHTSNTSYSNDTLATVPLATLLSSFISPFMAPATTIEGNEGGGNDNDHHTNNSTLTRFAWVPLVPSPVTEEYWRYGVAEYHGRYYRQFVNSLRKLDLNNKAAVANAIRSMDAIRDAAKLYTSPAFMSPSSLRVHCSSRENNSRVIGEGVWRPDALGNSNDLFCTTINRVVLTPFPDPAYADPLPRTTASMQRALGSLVLLERLWDSVYGVKGNAVREGRCYPTQFPDVRLLSPCMIK